MIAGAAQICVSDPSLASWPCGDGGCFNHFVSFFVYILTDTWKESVLFPHPSHPCRLPGPKLVIRGQRPLDSGERSRAPLLREEPLGHAAYWRQASGEE